MSASTMRPSQRYPGLRVRQLPGGAYSVLRERDSAHYLVFNDPTQHIGSAQRWHCVRRGTVAGARLTARTKDEIMRALAGIRIAADASVRIVA